MTHKEEEKKKKRVRETQILCVLELTDTKELALHIHNVLPSGTFYFNCSANTSQPSAHCL